MNFMQWLNSLDELLYEIMGWIVFFPVTLWRTLHRPVATMDYADRQLALPEAEQYADALSPPLFLALALLVAHAAELAMGDANTIVASHHGLAKAVTDDTSLVLLRIVLFSIFPLLMAARLVRRKGLRLTRATLRLPFYAQCYPAAVFALALSLGAATTQLSWSHGRPFGLGFMGAALVWYLLAETRWHKAKLDCGAVQAFLLSALGLVEGFAVLVLVGYLFTR